MAGNNFDFGRVSDPVKKFDQKIYDVSSHIARSTSSSNMRPPVHIDVTTPEQIKEVIAKTREDTDKALTNYADTLINKYNEQTRLLIEREASKNSTVRLTDNQTKEINRNLGKLNRLQNDVLTIRRQIEHNESNYKLKSNRLVILKSILYALILLIIVVILRQNFNVVVCLGDKKPGFLGDLSVYTIIIIGICIVFGSRILHNLYMNRNTNSIVFTKYDWDNPTDDEKRKIGINVPTAPTTGAKAVTCSPGSHVDPYNPALCVLNKCTCPYGTEHEGALCVEDGKESCKSCIGGYQLLNGVCKSTEPVCQTQSATASTA